MENLTIEEMTEIVKAEKLEDLRHEEDDEVENDKN